MSDASPANDPIHEFLERVGMGALAERMGIEVVELSRERLVATMPVEGNTQPMGLLHGGASCVLGESLGSIHANVFGPDGTYAVGVDINATHTGAVTGGTVTAVCTPIHLGRTMAVHEIVITGDNGQRCSTVRITNLYRERQ